MNHQELFEQCNHEYFAGCLSGYTVVVRDLQGLYAGEHKRKSHEIVIESSLSGDGLRRTLLHEMAHANSNDYHGKKWRQEMYRLAELGAPTQQDADLYA